MWSAIRPLIPVAFGAGLTWWITTKTQKRRLIADLRRAEFREVLAEISTLFAPSSYATLGGLRDNRSKVWAVVSSRIFVCDEIKGLNSWQDWNKQWDAFHKNLDKVTDPSRVIYDDEREAIIAYQRASAALIKEMRSKAKKEV